MKNPLIALFVCLALVLGSCASNNATSQPMSEAMNATCPMSGEAVDASKTAMFDGKTIAFCCERCQSKFEQLSDAEKAEKVKNLK